MKATPRLVSVLLVVGTAALLLLVVTTYEPRMVAPLGNMAEATAANPRVKERCETSGGAGGARTTTCYWTLTVDETLNLGWPWSDPSGSVKNVGAYLRKVAPIRVKFWRGTVYEIRENDGEVYLDYDDAAGWERGRQLFWIVVGATVVLASTVRIALELLRLHSGSGVHRFGERVIWLNGIGVFGALLCLFCAGEGRTWSGAIVLGLFAGGTELLGGIVPRAGGACEPARASELG